ncbi:MAG: DUF1934 domain-containing protein [Lachnospiraceae bacterium]|nr:DUF1934 domain-containing protein [Lachnospiraceae bacterium]
MTKDVLVTIKGMQFLGMDEEPEEPIEIVTAGNYYFRNGSHFVKYEEVFEGIEDTTSSLVKIKPQSIEVIKKGAANVHMVFEPDKKNITYYDTPFGIIQMGIATTRIDVREKENRIQVEVDYSLDMNDSYVADCVLNMNIQSKENS